MLRSSPVLISKQMGKFQNNKILKKKLFSKRDLEKIRKYIRACGICFWKVFWKNRIDRPRTDRERERERVGNCEIYYGVFFRFYAAFCGYNFFSVVFQLIFYLFNKDEKKKHFIKRRKKKTLKIPFYYIFVLTKISKIFVYSNGPIALNLIWES